MKARHWIAGAAALALLWAFKPATARSVPGVPRTQPLKKCGGFYFNEQGILTIEICEALGNE